MQTTYRKDQGVFDYRSGQLVVEAVPLAAYGLESRYPKLARLQAEVFGLEKQRASAASDGRPTCRTHDTCGNFHSLAVAPNVTGVGPRQIAGLGPSGAHRLKWCSIAKAI